MHNLRLASSGPCPAMLQWSNAWGPRYGPDADEQHESGTGASREASSSPAAHVLLVEDNPGDVLLVRESLDEHRIEFDLVVIDDGEKALRHVEQASTLPSLVVLDLNLPKRSGADVLAAIRSNVFWEQVPIVVLSSSESPEDRRTAMALGATMYVRKPLDLQEFMQVGAVLKKILQGSGS